MGWPKCNQTDEYDLIDETPLGIGIKFHTLGLGLSAGFGIASVVLSLYLIWRHGTHYLKPFEQKHIIRILFMVPIYAVVSFLSYYFYKHSIYFAVIRDCYEAVAIASFFTLVCHYIAPDLHSQKDYFRRLKPKQWLWLAPPSWTAHCCGARGPFKTPRSGLTWFNIIWVGVFQYCFVRVFMTIVSVVSQALHRYCLESLSPAFAHVWTQVFTATGVSIAMYCLIQFYYQLRADLVEHKPFLKLIAIKLVIFLSFWQTIIISFLTSTNVIKSSPKIAQPDIKIGIPSLLLCMEMFFFALLHLFAYPWKVYDIQRSALVVAESGPGDLPDSRTAYKGGVGGYRAYLDALNMWDLVKGVARGVRWIFVGRKTRELDISYKGQVDGTQLQTPRRGPSFNGRKPGSYQRLGNDPDEPPWSQNQLGKPMPIAQSQETGIVEDRRYDSSPYRQQSAPGIQVRDEYGQDIGVRNEYGQEVVGPGAGAVDTGYHGAAAMDASRGNQWPMGEGNRF